MPPPLNEKWGLPEHSPPPIFAPVPAGFRSKEDRGDRRQTGWHSAGRCIGLDWPEYKNVNNKGFLRGKNPLE